jgi:hypothetical protein
VFFGLYWLANFDDLSEKPILTSLKKEFYVEDCGRILEFRSSLELLSFFITLENLSCPALNILKIKV